MPGGGERGNGNIPSSIGTYEEASTLGGEAGKYKTTNAPCLNDPNRAESFVGRRLGQAGVEGKYVTDTEEAWTRLNGQISE